MDLGVNQHEEEKAVFVGKLAHRTYEEQKKRGPIIALNRSTITNLLENSSP